MDGVYATGYFFDSALQVLALGQRVRATMTNPSGSNQRIIIAQFVMSNTAGALLYATITANPTTTLSAGAAVSPKNVMIGSDVIASVADIRIDKSSSALAGGSKLVTMPVSPSARTAIDLNPPIVVMPGNTLAIEIAAGLAADVLLVTKYREEPIV